MENTITQDKQTIKLTNWEVANFHLPAVCTMTIYEGDGAVEFLRNRLALIIQKNPWLTSRIVKASGKKEVPCLEFETKPDTDKIIDQYIKQYNETDASISLGLPYPELYTSILPFQCADPKPATNANEVMFKISLVPIKDVNGAAPLQNAIAKEGFALIVSMNHILGDGHTYYKLYNMLNEGVAIESMNPVRKEGFEEAKTKVVGEAENGMLTSLGFGLGIVGTYLASKIVKRPPQNVLIHEVDPNWAQQEKHKAKEEGTVPFISTNDAVTSWFFRTMGTDINLMLTNFRSRKPSILDLSEEHVGNYEANVPYFPQDVASPSLIRQSISSTSGEFKAKRAADPQTKIPGFRTLIKNRTSIITNWASFCTDLILKDKSDKPLQPKLHLPIMKTDGMIMSIWNTAVVFKPRANTLGLMMVTGKLDNETSDADMPLGKRLV